MNSLRDFTGLNKFRLRWSEFLLFLASGLPSTLWSFSKNCLSGWINIYCENLLWNSQVWLAFDCAPLTTHCSLTPAWSSGTYAFSGDLLMELSSNLIGALITIIKFQSCSLESYLSCLSIPGEMAGWELASAIDLTGLLAIEISCSDSVINEMYKTCVDAQDGHYSWTMPMLIAETTVKVISAQCNSFLVEKKSH